MPKITNDSGIYILELYVSSSFKVDNKFNAAVFKRGYYYYTGSAQRNLTKRVERHFRKDKKIRWHIDYLTSHPKCTITNSWLFFDKTKDAECLMNQDLHDDYNLTIPVEGFGNSDCRECHSHLLFSPVKISLRL